MTNNNERIALNEIDLDLLAPINEYDAIIEHLNALDMIPTTIDYYLDDAHADPESYLMNSPLFRAHNHITADDDFYTRYNDENCDMQISYRMIIESILAELHDALLATKNAHIIFSNYLLHK